MPVLVSFHLGQAQDCILTLAAMVMGLFAIVSASRDWTELGWGVLLKSSGHDRVQLLVLPSMSHHFIGVRAMIIALQAMEMATALLSFARQGHSSVIDDVVFAIISSTSDSAEAFKL